MALLRGGCARPAAPVPGRAERLRACVPPSPRCRTTPQLHRVPVGTWAAGQPRGVTALARLKIVQVRVRSRRALCHLCPLGIGRLERGARWGWHGAEGAAGRRADTSGGDVRCPKRGSGTVCSPQPLSPRGDRPGPALHGGQAGPARSQNLPPPPASLFPAQLPRCGRWARGSRPAGVSQRWH